jgi:uncharacterized protein DUF6916
MQRRKFITSCLLFGASSGLIIANGRSVFASPPDDIPIESQKDPLFMFTAATFEPYVGGYFQTLNSRGQLVALKLLKVERFQTRKVDKFGLRPEIMSNAIQTNSFSLLFIGEERLPQFTTIYKIEHAALGQFDLFLTANTGKQGELYYQAVFNHLI